MGVGSQQAGCCVQAAAAHQLQLGLLTLTVYCCWAENWEVACDAWRTRSSELMPLICCLARSQSSGRMLFICACAWAIISGVMLPICAIICCICGVQGRSVSALAGPALRLRFRRE